MARKSRARKQPHKPPSYGGDHGTGTDRARENTVLEPIQNEKGENPNNMGRRRRVDVIESITLTMRQEQAAKAVRDAYSRCEMLSSGSPIKERVQSSPKPDATVAAQVDAQSLLHFVMSAVPREMTYVVEHVCWYNLPVSKLGPAGPHLAVFKRAMDKVADRMRY